MLGASGAWSPARCLMEHHPDFEVRKTDLPSRLLGCVDLDRRIIWLAHGLDSTQERCTLAFEIAQIVHGPVPENPRLAGAYRVTAEEWAARRLVPMSALLTGFQLSYSLDCIAVALDVDHATLRSRLRCMTDEEQDAVMEVIRERAAEEVS